MDPERQCTFIMENGLRCTAPRKKGEIYCFKHFQSPAERAVMARQGFESGRLGRELANADHSIKINKPRHIRKVLVNVMNMVMDGKITSERGNCLIYAVGTLIRAFEIIDLERRMAALEARLAEKPEVIRPPLDTRFLSVPESTPAAEISPAE